MAHAARISELADGLILSVTGLEKTSRDFRNIKNVATRGLKDQSHARTNQFDVKSKLDGLIEKFAVLDRDDLSDALQFRLDELPTTERWLPEMLSLLLGLSNRPVIKTPPDALEALRSTEQPAEGLNWADIFATDEGDETGLWDDVERGYHSSGDEALLEDDTDSAPTLSTRATSVEGGDRETLAQPYLVQPDPTALEPVKKARNSDRAGTHHALLEVSELSAIRESLSMLRGLGTNLFQMDRQNGQVSFAQNTTFETSLQRTTGASLQAMANMGSEWQSLRLWAHSQQSKPYMRTCQASCQQTLLKSGERLSAIEERFVLRSANTAVSIVDVRTKVEEAARPLLNLSKLIRATQCPSTNSPFTLLNELYQQVCSAQLVGDDELLNALSEVLFPTVQTYLRPVTEWMIQGRTPAGDSDFLVVDADPYCGLGELWHARCAIRNLSNGKPATPQFLHDFAAEIFALGKARMFLHQLHNRQSDERHDSDIVQDGPDFSAVRQQISETSLMPFSETFGDFLKSWISTTTDAAPVLKRALLYEHGLLESCHAVEHVYFSANGANFEAFAKPLIERIEHLKGRQPNAFILTELARETLGNAPEVDRESISVATDPVAAETSTIFTLQHIRMKYNLQWPVQNVTREKSLVIQSHAFAFLLQTFFTHSILANGLLDLRQLPSTRQSTNYNPLLRLRQRLLAFSGLILTHITTVGRVLSEELRARLTAAPDIDAMVAVYSAHKQRLETALLLGRNLGPVRDAVVSLLGLSEKLRPLWEAGMESQAGAEGSGDALGELDRELVSLLAFVTAGVKGVSRSGGEVLLGSLAERLEWMVP